MQKLIENVRPIWGTEPKNHTGAASTSDVVSLKNCGGALIIIQTGAWAGGTAAVTLKECTAVAGTGATAVAFTLQYTNVAGSDDTLTETAVTSNTFNLTTANKMHVIDFKSSQLSDGFDCLRVDVASPGANNDFYGVIIIPYDLSYPAHPNDQPSMIVD
jgi:hypothetical protein